jgi:redox-sensitive bicupin YhaK (pirin superfamily)
MWHSEINNRADEPMRFIQMWFLPSKPGLRPSVEQMRVDKKDRTNHFLLLVSNDNRKALKIFSDAQVYSSFLQAGHTVKHEIHAKRGVYLYVLEGGPVNVSEYQIPALGAAKITEEMELMVNAEKDAELLLVDVVV